MRGLYASAEGMLLQQRRQEAITNNLANLNTPAYKYERTSARTFAEELLWRLGDTTPVVPVGAVAFGVSSEKSIVWNQGPLSETGRPLDLAVNGEGFFVLETGEGLRYSREGTFQLDKEGFLRTQRDDYVLGSNGERIFIGEGEVSISSDGRIIVNGEERGGLAVANPRLEDIRRMGEGMYAVAPGTFVAEAEEFEIKQGFLERSNIDLTGEVTRALEALRAYETNQRMVQAHDSILKMAASRLGSLR